MVRNDSELGGFSTSHIDIETDSTPLAALPISENSSDSKSSRSVGHFHGVLNLDLPPNRPDIVQSGYAMFRTRDQRPTSFSAAFSGLFGSEPFWDWSACSHLLLRVKGDRRKYFINVQAESAIPTDIYQHRLFLKTPGQWETVLVPLNDFILTNWGVIQEQRKINLEQVKTVGIGLVDKQYGPFSLFVDTIQAVNTKYVNIPNQDEAVSNATPAQKLPGKDIPFN